MGIGPDNLGDFYPDWVNDLKDEDLRPEILQLGKVITDRAKIKLGLQKITKYDPEYWAVANLAPTKEIAELALSMGGIRKPKTFKELLEITGLDEKTLEERLEKASWTGLLEWNYENEAHEKQWVLPMFVPGSAEFSNMNQDFLNEHPEMGRFFERMSRLPLEGLTHMVPPGGAGIGMHVIPVEDAISMEQEAIGLEKKVC